MWLAESAAAERHLQCRMEHAGTLSGVSVRGGEHRASCIELHWDALKGFQRETGIQND